MSEDMDYELEKQRKDDNELSLLYEENIVNKGDTLVSGGALPPSQMGDDYEFASVDDELLVWGFSEGLNIKSHRSSVPEFQTYSASTMHVQAEEAVKGKLPSKDSLAAHLFH